MIEYYKGAYGLNLLFRVHGSATYKALIPGVVSVGIYLAINKQWRDNEPLLGHPYGIGVLVSSVSFLIIFRANFSYQRYWEACSAVHHMQSKWMDATVHTGVFHMQCSHYESIKPPNYFDHPELNKCQLTRDRERHLGDHPTEEEISYHSNRPTKTINALNTRYRKQAEQRQRRNKDVSTIGSSSEQDTSRRSTFRHSAERASSHLIGPGRLDGGWGTLFSDGEGRGSATFFDTRESFLDEVDHCDGGFASTKGGRTPSLFLQELVHLSSLCSAVALSTLRNDIEGYESPLDMYTPGAPWPAADPDKLPEEEQYKYIPKYLLLKNVRYWFGMDRTAKARTLYNATRPMLVIGGVSNNEIAFLQRAKGPSAKTTLAWSWLSEFITREHLAGSTGKVGPPIISRLIQFLSDGMIFYNHARKIMYIPFPFPHAQLSVFFILTIVVFVPFLLDQFTNETWLGALLTGFTVTCLSGLHEVGRELENPFRNIPNEIPLCTLQAFFNEALITMYAGYHPDSYWNAEEYMKHYEGKKKGSKKEGGGDGGDRSGSLGDEVPATSDGGSEGATSMSGLQAPKETALIPDSKEQSQSGGNTVSNKRLVELQRTLSEQSKEIDRLRLQVESRRRGPR